MIAFTAGQKRSQVTKAQTNSHKGSPWVPVGNYFDSMLLTQTQIDSAAYFHGYYAREAISQFNFYSGNDIRKNFKFRHRKANILSKLKY